MKKILFFFIFSLSLLSLPAFYKKMTHGFRPSKLEGWLSSDGEEDFLFTEKQQQEMTKLLKEPFSYIGRGLQSYVFQSADGQVVIKLFKKINPCRWIQSVKNKPDSIDSFEKAKNMVHACHLAFHLAREETGLIQICLGLVWKDPPVLVIKNRLGFSCRLPLNRYSFAIQKKAKPLIPVLMQALQRGAGESLIDSYLELIYHRTQKGICNRDLSFKNFGMVEGRVIEIDFGNYVYRPEEKALEFERAACEMRRFLQKHGPEILSDYDRKVEKYRCAVF